MKWLRLACLFFTLGVIASSSAFAAPKDPKAEDIKLSPYQEAEVAYQAGKQDQALSQVNTLLSSSPNDAKLLLLKGRILIKQGQYKEAQDCLFMANDKDQSLNEVHFYLGEAAFHLQAWGEAVQYYRIYLSKVPGATKATLKIIYCYLAAGDLHNSSQLIAVLNPTDNTDPSYYFARAALAFATNKTAMYQETLQQVRTIYGIDTYSEYEPDFLFVTKNIKPAPAQG